MVPVRSDLVEEVYRFIADRSSAGASAASGSGEESARLGSWSDEDLRAIVAAATSLPSLERTCRVMDELAAQPGQRFTITELTQRLGLTHGELRGGFSGFTRWINGVWGESDNSWPFDTTWTTSTNGTTSTEQVYVMDTHTATRWQAVRAS